MASYRIRPDGLLEVQQDDGSVSPGLPPSLQGSLEAEGIMPAVPAELGLEQSGATASLFGGGGFSVVDPSQAPPDTYRAPNGGRPTSDAEKIQQTLGSFGVQADLPRGAQPTAPSERMVDPSTLVGGESGTGAQRAPDPREAVAAEVMAEMARGTRYVAPRPARDVLVGYTEQGRAPLPEEEMERRRGNWSEQAAEQRWQGQLAAERADREQMADYVELQNRFQQVERERELNERREATAARLKAEADEAKAAIQSVNPNEYWEEMGGASRFAAILAVAMSGFAAGFTGSGRNTALEMLQQAVRDNIDAQKEKIAQQEDRYSEARAAYERALAAAGGDERAADLIYEIGLSRVFADQARVYASQVDSDLMRSQAEQLALQMEEQIAEKEAELQGLTRVRAAQFVHQEARAGGVIRPTYEQALERVGKRHELEEKIGLRDRAPSPDDMKRMIVLEGGQRVYAPSESDRAVLRDKIQNAEKILSAIDTQLDIINTPGKSLSPELRAKATANARVLGGFARNLLVGPGAVTDSEREIIDQAVAQDAAGFFALDTTNKAALEILRKYTERDRRDALDQVSASPQRWQPLTPPDQVRGATREGW